MKKDQWQADTRYKSTQQAWEAIWDQASVDMEMEAMTYDRAQRTLHTYAAYLPDDALILEAGSGLSAAMITLRQMGHKVIGLDYALNALLLSREYDPTLPVLAGDVHALPHPDNSLGGYLSFGVLEHFEHGMQPALAEAYRVLNPGGVLVLTIPYPNFIHRFVTWRRQRQGVSPLNDDQFYESTYTRTALADNVTQAGFEIVHLSPTSHSFTLWGLGGPFRQSGYYRTTALAEALGAILRVVLPWAFNFSTLVIGRK
jgi:SAM-dependent methyltransferase